MARRAGSILCVVVALASSFAAMPARAQSAGDPSLQRLVLEPARGTTFKIVAEYDNTGKTCEANKRKPLRARYAGRLELVRTRDGKLAIVNELTFQNYLEGLAEVPRSWPIEALKAQVIAARSYALYHYNHNRPSPIGYDLCSTDACQVYRGLVVSEGAFGDAWKRAVRETAGRILEYRGEPIQSFYFSTSWGRTVSNAEGFGGSPLPYLKPTTGEDDDAPLAHWHSEIPLTDLTAILRAAGRWSGPLITSASVRGSSLVVRGGSASATISLDRFRRDANNQADCLFPGKYPPIGKDGKRIPQTVPSPHFTIVIRNGVVILDGRGWGHGVGMSQYGARSLASRGRSAEDILAHFYGGLRPTATREPGALRVLLADQSIKVVVVADGNFTARGPSGSVTLGRQFTVSGGRTLRMLRAGSITPVLSIDPIGPETQRVLVGGRAAIQYELASSVKVQPILLQDGKELRRGEVVSQTSGPNAVGIDLVDAGGSPLPAGTYAVTIEATDGVDTVQARPVAVTVEALPPPVKVSSPGGDDSSRTTKVTVAALVLGACVVGFALALRNARRRNA